MITPEMLARNNTEHGHQAALFCYAAASGIPELKWLFAVPNGFYGSAAQKGKMKAEGLKSGVSDICLPCSMSWMNDDGQSHFYCGLFIELKTDDKRNHKNGGLSGEQVEFSQFVIGQGYKFVIAYSWLEAREMILQYLGKM